MMMIRIVLAGLAIILAGGILGAYYPVEATNEDDREKERLIMFAVRRLIESRHFSPAELDDDFSREVFKAYMKRLDGGKRFITIDQYDLMDDFENEIDDAFEEQDLEFFDLSYDIINRGVDKVREIYPDILNAPFDFTIEEDIELDGESLDYARNDAELRERWRLYLKYETLTRIASKLEEQEKEEDPEGGKKSITELEVEAREAVKEMMDDWFERLEEVRRSDRFEAFLSAVTNTYDPHTDYFNPKRKDDFDISMSQRLEGIGARLQRSGSYTKVSSIVPGGPAWKQGDLQVDDMIHAVAQYGEEAVDINGMHIDDVVGMIRGDKGTKVVLTVKHVDGDMQDITIKRDVVNLDQGLAQSVLLDYPGKIDKVGFIKLPKFYADFENPDGRSCAEDVAIELEKLKKQDVSGIILDLRNNSGGSLADVVEMSGLFIEEGPIVQVKNRAGEPFVHRDKDPEVQYAGPLIVMVNEYSASASEILAAALQDYGRAVIIGSKSTFGKGTVQRFYDLDRVIRGNADLKPLGQLKLTMQKFYRIDGGSTQLRGVEPDIVLPDRFSKINVGERELDSPMPWTAISPVEFKQDVVDLSSLEQIQQNSYHRIEGDEIFNKVSANAERVARLRDLSSYPLQLDEYRRDEKERQDEASQFRNMFPTVEELQVTNLPEDEAFIQLDSTRIGRNDAWVKAIKKDIYIQECLNVMHDMIVAGVAVVEQRREKKP